MGKKIGKEGLIGFFSTGRTVMEDDGDCFFGKGTWYIAGSSWFLWRVLLDMEAKT